MENNTYLIDNLGLASFLAAKGLRLIGTEPAPNKRGIVAFRFSDPDNRAASLIADFKLAELSSRGISITN